jgi:hypothetical protein
LQQAPHSSSPAHSVQGSQSSACIKWSMAWEVCRKKTTLTHSAVHSTSTFNQVLNRTQPLQPTKTDISASTYNGLQSKKTYTITTTSTNWSFINNFSAPACWPWHQSGFLVVDCESTHQTPVVPPSLQDLQLVPTKVPRNS